MVTKGKRSPKQPSLEKQLKEMTEKFDRLRVLAYNLVEMSERDDQVGIKQSCAEARKWFDENKEHPY